jgi:protein gp37
MAENTSIEWCDHTWTPVVGCDAVSPACANCYAALMAARLESMGQEKYKGVAKRVGNTGKWTGKVTFWEPELVKPLTVRKASRWFLTSMGDVAHDALTPEQIAELFGVMAVAGATGAFHREQDGCTPQKAGDGSVLALWPNSLSGPHTFMVLTKRGARMAKLLTELRFRKLVSYAAYRWAHNRVCAGGLSDHIYPPWSDFRGEPSECWPMSNVFIGCTAENQERADELRPHMARIDAHGWKTFVSYEPALGPVDWTGWEFLKQLISGGESGWKARPSHPDWHRSARDFAAAHGIAYLFKQHGEWAPGRPGDSTESGKWMHINGDTFGPVEGEPFTPAPLSSHVVRIGKKAAGRLLDGVEHNGFPEA